MRHIEHIRTHDTWAAAPIWLRATRDPAPSWTRVMRAAARIWPRVMRAAAPIWTAAILTISILSTTCVQPAQAQLLSDSTFTWTGYARQSICRVRVFRSAPNEKKPFVIVLDELAKNEGRSTLDDARHVAELISRQVGIDPESAYWIFHWGDFSFEDARSSSKEVYLRATFRRTDSGTVGTPFWRLINRETVVEYTDRAYR